MKNKIFLIVIIFIGLVVNIFPQQTFRRAILLSRSVGNHIWLHAGATTSVPEEVTSYNTAHGYTGTDVVSMEKVYPYPVVGNEWYQWHTAFNNGAVDTYINDPDYDIIIIKTCFYTSDMYGGAGSPADTSTIHMDRSVYGYKWHWRSMLHIMETHPEKFFVMWTNAPNVEAETSPEQAAYSNWFCTWAKDTLAAGLDATYGAFPSNVYIFDYFHKLVNENYYERPEYADGLNDAHPNAAASDLIAPQFVQEIFDAAINYETIFPTGVDYNPITIYTLEQNYPNPFNPVTLIKYQLPFKSSVALKIFDILGNEIQNLVNEEKDAGYFQVNFDASRLSSGIYFCTLQTGYSFITKKMILMK